MQRLGVYGGSFDPPHVAHVLAAAYALSVGGLDRVIVVPVYAHAFHKQLAPFEQRLRLCERAFADLARVEISSIEARLPEPSRTLTTLEALREERGPEVIFRLIVGADVLADVSKWHAFDAVQRLAPLFVIGRTGYEAPEAPSCSLPEISSSEVRELIARGDADARRELQRWVPSEVLRYIDEHRLYAKP